MNPAGISSFQQNADLKAEALIQPFGLNNARSSALVRDLAFLEAKNKGPHFLTVAQIRAKRSERKVKWSRLIATLESLPAAAVMLDESRRIEFANAEFLQLLSFGAEEIAGMHVDCLLADRRNSCQKLRVNEQAQYTAVALRKSAANVPVKVSESRMEIEGQYRIVAIFQDRARQEEQLRTNNNFVAMVTHELKTPLNYVEGILSKLEDGELGSLTQEGIGMTHQVKQTCRRLKRLVNDLLDLERIRAGKITLECSNLQVSSVIKLAIESIQPILENRQIIVEMSDPELPCWADEDRLVQVLVNLLSNAIKYSPDRSQIKVCAEMQNSMLKISVHDQGKGVSAEKIAKIFERFESDAQMKGSTGLGLSICRSIVAELGGEISVTSEAGKGCVVSFTIAERVKENNIDFES